MTASLFIWLARYRRDPEAFAQSLTHPVLWVENPDEDDTSEDERSLHTRSGVSVPSSADEPHLLPIKKTKENAFQRGITVGRTPNNDLVVDHASVSRFHAWFQQGDDGSWWLADAGSKNGTEVGNLALAPRQRHRMTGGERLRFGSVNAWFLTPEKLLERLQRRSM